MLLKNVAILRNSNSLEFGDIRIDGRFIAEIGQNLVPHQSEEVLDFRGSKCVSVGFVNTHTHSPMSLLRAFAEDLPFNEWLFEKILPAEERLTPEAVYYGTMVSMMEMVSHGVVAFCDMYFHMDAVAQAVADFGMKAVLTRGLVDENGDDNGRLEEALKLYEKWHGFDDRIFVGLGPHAPYTCSKPYLRRILDIAKVNDMLVTMHFFENSWEREKYSPEEIMRLGFDEVHFLPVHCVHLNSEELKLLSNSYPSINVVSNMKLGNGVPPVAEMLKEGLKLTIGTDGPSSNNSLNPLFDTRVMVLTQKMSNPENVKVTQAYTILTKHGYEALRLNGGELAPGMPADLILIDLFNPQLQPINRALENLIHTFDGRVFATMVNGKFVYYDGKFPTIDALEVLERFTTFSRMVTGTEN
ncbi:amidohydrolase [Fervidobacterium thailandense]|uniref:Amidohydrolase n=1 Tax=Fervidobacterium thailandense TaxID=1008305 RepID=A0A1E3G4W6_9BACT|nr:amidohydrolase [Fervidobacterium thailandense]ODN30688.1 amidohydrolase [Fervidobacterium thailandense]